MRRLTSKKTLAVAAAVIAVAGGGAAIASSQGNGPSSAFFDSLAKHLGISTDKLKDATKAAAIDQVDAALKAGSITKEQADELKARINAGDFPLFFGPRLGFGPHSFGPGFHGGFHVIGGRLSAAADYLGLTTAELREKLAAGQSLADVAKAEGKSVSGLKQAIRDAVKKRLDAAVSNGSLTADQEKAILDFVDASLDDIVNGSFQHPRFAPFSDHPRMPGAFGII
jgi:hypothetical protein